MSQSIPILSDERLHEACQIYDQAIRRRQLRVGVGALVLGLCIGAAGWVGDVDLVKLATNIWRFPKYLLQLVPPLTWRHLGGDLSEWFWDLKTWSILLLETLLIGYLGTLLGAFGALLLCFHAAQNVSPSKSALFLSRRFLEFCRTVPDIVFALIFVLAFGLGPLPGVLALALHTLGALGKQFAEVVENIDMKPVEGTTAAGANWIATMRFAALPQIAPSLVSYALMRFEINVRGAAIMGFVGAGGIGQELLTAIRKFYYTDISAMLVLIIATVMIIDFGTERVRHSLLDFDAKA